MSMEHMFYFAKKNGDKYDVWDCAPHDKEYDRQKETFWMGRSSGAGEKVDRWFDRIEPTDMTSALLEKLGFEKDDNWYCDFDVIELNTLTKEQVNFVYSGYFLSDEVNAFLSDECYDIDDLLYSQLTPEVYSAKLQAEATMSQGVAADKREHGETLASDYMYFSFVDRWGLEYGLNFAKEIAELYQEENLCLIHYFAQKNNGTPS